MSKKKSGKSKKSISSAKSFYLDKPTSHGGWPGGHSGSYRDPNTPVNKQIEKFLKDLGLLDDENPRARLSEGLVPMKRVVLEGLLKSVLMESGEQLEFNFDENKKNKKRTIRLSRKIPIFEKMPNLSLSVTEKKFKSLFGEEFEETGIVDFSRFDIETIKYLAVEKKPTTFSGTFFENVVVSYMINKEKIPENNILNLNNIKKGFGNFDFYVGDIEEFKKALITSLEEKKREVEVPGYFIQVKSILVALQDSQFNKNLFDEDVKDRNKLFWKDISPYLNIYFSEQVDYPSLKFKVKVYVPGLKFETGTKRGDITKVDYTGQYQRSGGAGNMFKRNLSKVFKDNPDIYENHIKRSYKKLGDALAKLVKNIKIENIEKEYNDFFNKKEEIYAMKRIFSLDLVEEYYNYRRSVPKKLKLREGYKEPYTFFHALELLIENKELIRTADKNSSNFKSETYFINFFSNHLSKLSDDDKQVYLKKIKENKRVILDKAMEEKAYQHTKNDEEYYKEKVLHENQFFQGTKYLNYIYHRVFDELEEKTKLDYTIRKVISFLIDIYVTKSINENEINEFKDLIGKNIFEKNLNENDIDVITKNILIYMGINEVLITEDDYRNFYKITESLIEKIKEEFEEKLELEVKTIEPFLYSDYVYADNSCTFQLHSKEIDISFSNYDEISAIEKQTDFIKETFKSNDSFGTYPSIISAMYTINSGQARKISNLSSIISIFTGEASNTVSRPVLFDVSVFGGIKISEEPVYLSSSEMESFTRNIADFYARLTTSNPFRLIIDTKDDNVFSSYIEANQEYIDSKIIDIYQKLTSALDAQTYELRIEGNEEIEADLEDIVSIILFNANKYINKEIEQIINRIRRDRDVNKYTGSFDFDETTIKYVKAVLKKEFVILTDLFKYISYYKEESFFSRWQEEIDQFLIEVIDQNINNVLGKRIIYSVFLLIFLLNLFDYNELNSYKSKYKFLVSKSYKDFNFEGEIEPETQIEILPDPEEDEQDKAEILGLSPQDNNKPNGLRVVDYEEETEEDYEEETEEDLKVAESKIYKLVIKDLFEYLKK